MSARLAMPAIPENDSRVETDHWFPEFSGRTIPKCLTYDGLPTISPFGGIIAQPNLP
jgi:hypothetical protein